MRNHPNPLSIIPLMTLRQKMIAIRSYHFQIQVISTQHDGNGDLTMSEFRYCWMLANKAVTKWHLEEIGRTAYAKLRGGLVQEQANRRD